MTAAEKVMTELYETLLQLKYPGIAQATPKDMEETILGSESRLYLLSWLLNQSPVVTSEKFDASTHRAKLVEWYSNMGICINADALLGQVPMQDQIYTLRNLLMFMKNVLIQDRSNSCEESLVMNVLKKHIGGTINIISPKCSLTSKLNYKEAMQYLNNGRRSLSEKRRSTPEFSAAIQKAQFTSEVFGAHRENNSASRQEFDQEKVVEKFLEAFESISTWQRFKSDASTPPLWISMNSHVDKIHSNMTMLKETLHSKEEISNCVITDGLKKCEMPLDGIIEDIVIRLEEVNTLDMED